MSDTHTCSECDSILISSEPITKYQKSFELPLSTLLEFSSGSSLCIFFQTLIEECRWPRDHLQNRPNSRFSILFDDEVDSSYMLSVATLPRILPLVPEKPGQLRSATSRYRELLAWQCQIVTDPGIVSWKTYSTRLTK